MSKTYFGFAVADGMFAGDVTVTRKVVSVETVRALVSGGVIPALNPAHISTINAMKQRFGLEVAIPERAPMVILNEGDQLIVMSVRGLPRREGVAEYTQQEVDGATFVFSLWTVTPF
jgi:hypothetical protein